MLEHDECPHLRGRDRPHTPTVAVRIGVADSWIVLFAPGFSLWVSTLCRADAIMVGPSVMTAGRRSRMEPRLSKPSPAQRPAPRPLVRRPNRGGQRAIGR